MSYIGDLVTATLALDIIARRGEPLAQVVVAPAAAPLLARDPRVALVRLVRSARPLGWRAEVLRELWRARRLQAPVVNLEVYPPRWRFVQGLVRTLGLECRALDLPALVADNAASACGQPTSRPHRTDHYAAALGEAGESGAARLHLNPGEAQGVCARLAQLFGSAPQGPLVVVHAGSTDPGRRPRSELLCELLERLAAQRPVRTALVGVPKEAPLTAALAKRLGPAACLDLCGQLDLRGLMAVLSEASLFVGGDSGPLKIAEALGCPTLSFWAAGAPGAAFAGPRGPGHATFESDCSAESAAQAGLALLLARVDPRAS